MCSGCAVRGQGFKPTLQAGQPAVYSLLDVPFISAARMISAIVTLPTASFIVFHISSQVFLVGHNPQAMPQLLSLVRQCTGASSPSTAVSTSSTVSSSASLSGSILRKRHEHSLRFPFFHGLYYPLQIFLRQLPSFCYILQTLKMIPAGMQHKVSTISSAYCPFVDIFILSYTPLFYLQYVF